MGRGDVRRGVLLCTFFKRVVFRLSFWLGFVLCCIIWRGTVDTRRVVMSRYGNLDTRGGFGVLLLGAFYWLARGEGRLECYGI